MNNEDESDKMRRLARAALYCERRRIEGCFGTNVAAAELVVYGQQSLSVIEEVIQNEVFPHVTSGTNSQVLLSRFRGLDNLLISYFHIAGHTHADRVVTFLNPAPEAVLIVAALAAGMAFRAIKKQASDSEIPEALWNYFNDIAICLKDGEGRFIRGIVDSFYRSKP